MNRDGQPNGDDEPSNWPQLPLHPCTGVGNTKGKHG